LSEHDDALAYHEGDRPGKIEVVTTKPLFTQRDLSLAYTPGVAAACRAIHKNPDDVFRYTARGNLVAVITNGTAVLGLGDIGPLAGKPVMEGKANLFKKFADIDVFDIELQARTVDEMFTVIRAMAPTSAGSTWRTSRRPSASSSSAGCRRRSTSRCSTTTSTARPSSAPPPCSTWPSSRANRSST
jgi:malate dehydrogenase (oxaloacetate-decarboxylating)(NADP+)